MKLRVFEGVMCLVQDSKNRTIWMERNMKLLRLGAILLILAGISVGANSQEDRYVAGTHYRVLDTPVRTDDSARIEVIELFWYGCPGCYSFEPLMASWERTQPTDIDHKRLPAVWNSITELHAQAYFTAENLNVMEAVHNRFFEEFHENRNRLQNEVVIREFFESCGISPADFDRVFNSFSVRSLVRQAQTKMNSYGQAQTPSLFVNGKYVVTLGDGGYQQMLDIVDYLVRMERG
jgi:thiol:disulfide interchange protein DsbA